MNKARKLNIVTPQARSKSDQASRQISKVMPQKRQNLNWARYALVFTAMDRPGDNPDNPTITSTKGLQRATFTTPPQTVPGTNTTEPPPPPLRNKGPELGADNLTLEGVATELAPSDFVSQNYETLVALMQEETKKDIKLDLEPDLTSFLRQVLGTQTSHLQNLDTHENNDWRISVRDRLGSRDVHSRLGQRRSPSESPPSLDSEDSRRKRRRRVSSSSEDSSNNEDAKMGHLKSKNKYREYEDEDMSRPWRRQKVDAFTRHISDFSEDKKRRMPANVKTYDGTGDPDDHLKIFESAATIENWPQPVRSIDGFEELRRAFRLNFTQRKKCAKNPVELARVKQRQGESTSAYVERYKDECIHVKAAPNSQISGKEKPPPLTAEKGLLKQQGHEEQSRRQSNDQVAVATTADRGQRGGRGTDNTPLTMTPKKILATEGANFPKTTTNAHSRKTSRKGKINKERGKKRPPLKDKAYTHLYGAVMASEKLIKKFSQKFSHGKWHLFSHFKLRNNAVVEPLTIEINAAGHDITAKYIDGGALQDILYEHCFPKTAP
ncbi:hypothetical protein Tco_1563234 [Tanacetum coccineum]